MDALDVAARELADRLPSLLAAAYRVAATVSVGSHGRRRSGPGDGFWQFRRYQPGDPATAIDWRQSARSDPLYIRETEWAAAQSVYGYGPMDRTPCAGVLLDRKNTNARCC